MVKINKTTLKAFFKKNEKDLEKKGFELYYRINNATTICYSLLEDKFGIVTGAMGNCTTCMQISNGYYELHTSDKTGYVTARYRRSDKQSNYSWWNRKSENESLVDLVKAIQ